LRHVEVLDAAEGYRRADAVEYPMSEEELLRP
jgi:hypothetical protein